MGIRKKIFLFFILIFLFSCGRGFALEDLSSPLRIGLKYGRVDMQKENLFSETGFSLLSFDGESFQDIFQFSGEKNIYAEKDDSWRIQISGPMDTYHQTLDFLGKLSTQEKNIYPLFYKGSWFACSGRYQNEEEAKKQISRLSSFYGENAKVLEGSNAYVSVYGKDGHLFSYDADTKNFVFKSIESDKKPAIISYGKKKYRGGIGFSRYPDSALTVVNYIGIEPYLYGVLPKEMSGEWPLEALKAQAVAARNFAQANRGKHQKHGFDLCDSTHCQVYGGYAVEHPRSNRAVDETRGKLLMYEGEIVQAYYHSNSGGKTENMENVWSDQSPYIKGVDDPYSIGAPNTDWRLSYTKPEMGAILKNSGHDIGAVIGAKIKSVSSNGRVKEFSFLGSSGTVKFKKEKLRALLGYTTLKSMWFELGGQPIVTAVGQSNYKQVDLSEVPYMTADGLVTKAEQKDYTITDGKTKTTVSQGMETITFKGHGYGHGLGMSQWGAKKMAESGFNYEDILKHYYRGTSIQ